MAIAPRIILIPILVFLACGLLFLPRQVGTRHQRSIFLQDQQALTRGAATFHAPLKDFWRTLAPALEASRPHMYAIEVEQGRPADSAMKYEPLVEDKRPPERLNLTIEGETELFHSHNRMRLAAKRLGPQLPYAAGTTGIVTTANPEYMPILLVSLRLMRQTGCNLPVDVYLGDWSEYDQMTCDVMLPSLNARCLVLSDIYSMIQDIDPPAHYQFKILAILFSPYQHVLFLDSDDYPAHDPTELFAKAPYTTHGLVTWPDLWASTTSSHYYHIAGLPQVPVSTRQSTESGQVMIDKSRHRESLLMMVYYNFYGPSYYYPLFSQNAHGAGDKETFIHAAMVMELPWYQVRMGPAGMGGWQQRGNNQNYIMAGLSQADPSMDFDYGEPVPNHLHPDKFWMDSDLNNPDSKVKEILPQKPRPLFVHQSMFKTDPKAILDDKNQAVRDEKGHWQRMWGPKKDLVHDWGYDIEERLWEVLVSEGCRPDPTHKTCIRLRQYFIDVFGSEATDA